MSTEERERPDIVTEAHIDYLGQLRLSGKVNMMGADPYLERDFGLSRREAREILMYWMNIQ